MTRYAKSFLVAAALVCAGLLSGGSIARGEEGGGNRGGVLFFAGFDGSKDADYAVGDPKARSQEGGGSLGAEGVASFRGSALRTGDGLGYVEYSAEGNINPRQGTIEFWMYAQDWNMDDGHVHRFIDVSGEGGIEFRIRPPGVQDLIVRAGGSPSGADASVVYVPPPFAADAIMEAAESGIKVMSPIFLPAYSATLHGKSSS